MNDPEKKLLIAALDARIIEIEIRIEVLTSSMKLYADPQDLATKRGIEAHTLSLMKIRRHHLANVDVDLPPNGQPDFKKDAPGG